MPEFAALSHPSTPTSGDSHRFRFMIRDGAGQFTRSYDTVLQGSGITAIRTPPRSPQANAYAEGWVRTLRHELLDRTIIWDELQLRKLLDEYIAHHNTTVTAKINDSDLRNQPGRIFGTFMLRSSGSTSTRQTTGSF